MNFLYKGFCRTVQAAFRVAMPILPWRQPELIDCEDSFGALIKIAKDKGIGKMLLVTGPNISAKGLHQPLLDAAKEGGVEITIYNKTVQNPTIDNVEAALALYKENDCQAVIGFGGGSPMDCAKIVCARAAKPKQPVHKMKGVLKIHKKTPLLFAVPTTAGSGSETTLAAVISDASTHEKFPINDTCIIPQYAVLCAKLTTGLPPAITAATGMDAMTHAIEAYIGKSTTKNTRKMSEEAVNYIFKYIKRAYDDGNDLEARQHMLVASYNAGVAFTRAYVGYVHTLAHALGGMYGTPHGQANAVILPYILDYYGKSIYKPLAKLADVVGIAQDGTEKEKAEAFIAEIKALNQYLGIPKTIEGIQAEDIPLLAKHSYSEAHPLYPVPKFMDRKTMEEFYVKLSGK